MLLAFSPGFSAEIVGVVLAVLRSLPLALASGRGVIFLGVWFLEMVSGSWFKFLVFVSRFWSLVLGFLKARTPLIPNPCISRFRNHMIMINISVSVPVISF